MSAELEYFSNLCVENLFHKLNIILSRKILLVLNVSVTSAELGQPTLNCFPVTYIFYVPIEYSSLESPRLQFSFITKVTGLIFFFTK